MAFATSFNQSSSRHWKVAELLRTAQCSDSAAYHYGFAAECALKFAIHADPDTDGRVRKHLSPNPEKDLRPIARLRLSGRHQQILRQLLLMPSYFADWDVAMRYAPSGSIDETKCTQWRSNAVRTLHAAGIAT